MGGDQQVGVTLLRAVISASGLSRRKAFEAIREGRVTEGGAVATEPSAAYSGRPLRLDGRPLGSTRPRLVYLMLNKPAGIVTTVSDTHGRPTVLDLVPPSLRVPGLHPAGRLDLETTGLLLLTNDGELTFRLTHPSREVDKEYWLRARPQLTAAILDTLRHGVEIDGVRRRPVEIRPLPVNTGYEVAITIGEGRKRQVRRMLEAVGARVTALTRVREGPLVLGGLASGEVRALTREELEAVGVSDEAGGRAARRREATRSGASRSGRSGRRR